MVRRDAPPLQLGHDEQSLVNEYLEPTDVNALTGVNRWHTSQYGCQRACPEGKFCYTSGPHGCELGTEFSSGVVRCCQFTQNLRFLSVAKEMTHVFKIPRTDFTDWERRAFKMKTFVKKLTSNIDIPRQGYYLYPKFHEPSIPPYSGYPFRVKGMELVLDNPSNELFHRNDQFSQDNMDDLVRLALRTHPANIRIVATPHVYNQLSGDLRSHHLLFFRLHTTALTPAMLVDSPNIDLVVSGDVDGHVVLSNLLRALEAQSRPTRKRVHAQRVLEPVDFQQVIDSLDSFSTAVKGEIEIYSETTLFRNIVTGQFGENIVSSENDSHVKVTGVVPIGWRIDRYVG